MFVSKEKIKRFMTYNLQFADVAQRHIIENAYLSNTITLSSIIKIAILKKLVLEKKQLTTSKVLNLSKKINYLIDFDNIFKGNWF